MKYKIIKRPDGQYRIKYKKLIWHFLQEWIGNYTGMGFYQPVIFKTQDAAMKALVENIKFRERMKERFKMKDVVVKEGEL